MKVTVEIKVYELDGEKVPSVTTVDNPPPKLTLQSHWNRGELVVIHAGGKAYTVSALDLEGASMRCRKHLGES